MKLKEKMHFETLFNYVMDQEDKKIKDFIKTIYDEDLQKKLTELFEEDCYSQDFADGLLGTEKEDLRRIAKYLGVKKVTYNEDSDSYNIIK